MRWMSLVVMLAACGDKGGEDADGDGYSAADDCDDTNPNVSPAATESCNGKDDDCDGIVDNDPADGITAFEDADQDGAGDPATRVYVCALSAGLVDNSDDCDDTDSAVLLGGQEICDGIDNDCDGSVDDADSTLDLTTRSDWYRDADGDGYGVDSDVVPGCDAPDGYVADEGDCDDLEPAMNPAATEVCDELDNDCNDLVDDDDGGLDTSTAPVWHPDEDDDGYGDTDIDVLACVAPDGTTAESGDCDDDDPAIHPDAPDTCGNSTDDNCDGAIDETCPMSAATADWMIQGVGSGDLAGASISALGDFNGDGRDDLVIGARRYDGTDGDEGRADVFFGPVSGALDLDDADLQLSGEATGDESGVRVRLQGDLDGDGYADLYVAARASDRGALDGGAVYLVHGPATGAMSLSAADAVLTGASERDYLGELALGPAGDVNGDGVQDVYAGAWGVDTTALDVGQAYVFFGPVTGEQTTASADLTITGDALFDQAGGAWAMPGDLDGDGHDDVMVAAPGADKVVFFLGEQTADTLLLSDADIRLTGIHTDGFGSSVVVSDIDGDGYAEVVVGAPFHDAGARSTGALFGFTGPVITNRLYSSAHWTLSGGDEGTLLGTPAAELEAGDIDGDGAHELLVGSIFDDGTANRAGAITVWRGPLTGTTTVTQAWRTIRGEAADDRLGTGVTSGDLDGDGLYDLIVGAPEQDAGPTNGGVIYGFAGSRL